MKSECREAFEKFAEKMGFPVEYIDNVYEDKETHLIWIGYREAFSKQNQSKGSEHAKV